MVLIEGKGFRYLTPTHLSLYNSSYPHLLRRRLQVFRQKTSHIVSLGCAKNSVDSNSMAQLLTQQQEEMCRQEFTNVPEESNNRPEPVSDKSGIPV
jgi:hypothetical protein